MKDKLDEIISDISGDAESNKKNLVTGAAILVLVGLFSVWYFTNQSSQTNEQLLGVEDTSITTDGSGANLADVPGTNSPEVDASQIDAEGMITVQEKEGLWQVAERVCGDGERYNFIADENGLSIWWAPTYPGQRLKANCGYN